MSRVALLLPLVALLSGCAGLVPRAAGDAALQRLVSEDDQVRITELRQRGQTQRISVDPKDSAAPRYEITPQAAGSDPSAAKSGAGQRVWNVLSF
jgi:hypothetical protein